MDEMMKELTEDPRRDGSEAVRVNSRQLPLPPSVESGSSATVSTLRESSFLTTLHSLQARVNNAKMLDNA